MDYWINVHSFRCFPVKGFFIVMCVIALMLPVSADQVYTNTPRDPVSLTFVDNSSASVPGSPVNAGTSIQGGQNAGKKVPGVLVVPVTKEQNTNRISPGQSYHKIGKVQIMKGTMPDNRQSTNLSLNTANNLPTIEILDQNDTVLYTKKFNYQNQSLMLCLDVTGFMAHFYNSPRLVKTQIVRAFWSWPSICRWIHLK